MASIQQRGKGSFLIQFYDKNGKHRGVSLSGTTKKVADDWARRIDILNTSQRSGYPIDGNTADWLQGLGDVEAAKLAKVGLVEARAVSTLGDFLTKFFKTQKKDWALLTYRKHKTTKKYLLEFFKPDKRLRDFTPADADAFQQYLKHECDTVDSDATMWKHISNARVYFNAAIKSRQVTANPFSHLKIPKCAREEFYHITPEVAQKVLDACPDSQWRLIFAFARYGGLRIPSELNGLQWSHVNWEQDKILIHAPKTIRHKPKRFIPIFPELRPYLEDAWVLAQERGDRDVITIHRKGKKNEISGAYIRSRMAGIIESAGVEPWNDLFKNCRSTRETELADTFPEHVVCSWIGNSVAVARKHYLRVTDEHFRLGATATVMVPAKVEEKTEAAKPAMGDDVDQELMTQVMMTMTDILGHDATELVEELAKVLGWPALAQLVLECQNPEIVLEGLEPPVISL
ncbi:phage integrase SAM-like domain-containing protein [Bremerella sp. JC770]|uniref:tyrosine-type recombinase/integrase n=1 Tax=Bremerella sp. JC770 TaxID=3232137 RepID=UPI00345951B6